MTAIMNKAFRDGKALWGFVNTLGPLRGFCIYGDLGHEKYDAAQGASMTSCCAAPSVGRN